MDQGVNIFFLRGAPFPLTWMDVSLCTANQGIIAEDSLSGPLAKLGFLLLLMSALMAVEYYQVGSNRRHKRSAKEEIFRISSEMISSLINTSP